MMPFSYCSLKYVHNLFTDEALNIGMLGHNEYADELWVKCCSDVSRVKALYPDLNEQGLLNMLRGLEAHLMAKKEELEIGPGCLGLFFDEVLGSRSVWRRGQLVGGICMNFHERMNELAVEYYVKLGFGADIVCR